MVAFSDWPDSPCSSWADLFAYCYLKLKDLDTRIPAFLSEYCHPAPSNHPNAPENPNLSCLRNLAEEVSSIAADNLRRHNETREFAIQRVIHLAQDVKLAPYGKDLNNEATRYWAILAGIDMAYHDSYHSLRIRRRGPLNATIGADVVGVYLQPLDSYILNRYRESKLERIPNDDLNSHLRSLILYDFEQGKTAPNIVLVRSRDFNRGFPYTSSVLRIGLCLFSQGALFSFEDQNLPIRPRFTSGSSYIVEYANNYEKLCMAIVLPTVDAAIAAKCDILVFPEYVMKPECQQELSEHLERKDDRGQISLVVAGSSWTKDNDNVCILYRADGREIGRYFKYSSYFNPSKPYREALAHPGEECTIVDIEGLGRVLPSICKDLVSDERYTANLAHRLHPQVICAPAFSDSLERGFSDQLRNSAERSLTATCVCDCCSARVFDGVVHEQATIACVPQEEIDIASGRPRKQALAKPFRFRCDESCAQQCKDAWLSGDDHACLRIVEIDYSDRAGTEPWPSITVDGIPVKPSPETYSDPTPSPPFCSTHISNNSSKK